MRGPTVMGLKTTWMLQLAPAATVEQLFDVMLKSPVVLSRVTEAGKVELLVHWKVWGAVGKPTG